MFPVLCSSLHTTTQWSYWIPTGCILRFLKTYKQLLYQTLNDDHSLNTGKYKKKIANGQCHLKSCLILTTDYVITLWSLWITFPLCKYLVAFSNWYIIYLLCTSFNMLPLLITLCRSVSVNKSFTVSDAAFN